MIKLRNRAIPIRVDLDLGSELPHGSALCRWGDEYVIWHVWYDRNDDVWDCENGIYFFTYDDALEQWDKPYHGRTNRLRVTELA